jgi:7 transmembrane sweet-taste receptor of 3 GCPR
VSQGYEEEPAQQYIETIRSSLSSSNVVTDIRFPTATDILDVLDTEFYNYLNNSKQGRIPESRRDSARSDVAKRINIKWRDIISSYDKQGSTKVPILEAYQKSLGVYVPEVDLNQIHGLRAFGYSLAGIIIMCSLIFAAWSIIYREAPVVRASQPIFLVMICAGAFVFGSALFPLGIDDSVASVDACSEACMSIPWLLALGWTILFSGIFAKLRRVNIVFRNASRFRRVAVTHQDVLLPVSALRQ